MPELYDLLEPYIDPENHAQEAAVERCGESAAEWLDALTEGRITEQSTERVLFAAAACLAELSELMLSMGAESTEDLWLSELEKLRELAVLRLGRFGLL